MTCPCKRMAALLRSMGATHAAAMHGKIGGQWTPKDWLLHFEEEEHIVFPILIQLGYQNEVEELIREHELLRPQIERGYLDRKMLDSHAEKEDNLVLSIEPMLKKNIRRRPYSFLSHKGLR